MLRILLADDHAVVRQGVKQILADAFAQATLARLKTRMNCWTWSPMTAGISWCWI